MAKPTPISEDILLPGEPLRAEIHEDNRRLLEADLKERMALMSAKMSKREHKLAVKRYRRLHRFLNRRGYNKLVQQRDDLLRQFAEIKHAFLKIQEGGRKTRRMAELAAHGRDIARTGRQLNERIDRLLPAAQAFDEVAKRLSAHEHVLRFEREDRENEAAFFREARVWEAQIKAVFRQSARLHYRYEDKDGSRHTEIPKIDRIISLPDKHLYMIRTVAQTPFERWLGKWHSALPYNVDIADLVSDETLENLSAATNRTVTVERSKRGNNLFYVVSRLDSPDGIPARVLYSKVIQWYPSSDHAKTPWCAGVTSDRRVKWFNLEDTPHILVAGSTHSGKSNHINAMIATIVTMSSPAEVRLLLVDNKGGVEFTHWAGTAHLLRPMVKQVDHVLPTLKFAREIMERRLARFEAIKAKNLASFNDKVKVDQRIPRIVVVVDELATLLGLGDLTTDIQHELRVLTSQGRATGVHVIACTQHSSVDVLPGWVKTNMVMRIAGKMPTASASLTIANSATAASLPDIPGRLLFAIGSHEWIAQSPLISDDEIARAVAISRDYPAPDNMEFEQPEQIRIEQRFGRDDFLNLVVNEFDLKLSPQAIHQKYGNDLAPLREIRAIFDAIKTLKVIEYEGLTYRVKRLGNLYKLIPEPVIQQGADEDTESVTVLESEEAPVLP